MATRTLTQEGWARESSTEKSVSQEVLFKVLGETQSSLVDTFNNFCSLLISLLFALSTYVLVPSKIVYKIKKTIEVRVLDYLLALAWGTWDKCPSLCTCHLQVKLLPWYWSRDTLVTPTSSLGGSLRWRDRCSLWRQAMKDMESMPRQGPRWWKNLIVWRNWNC